MATKNSTFVNDTAPAVDDTWLNMTQSERNGLITSSDQTISTVDSNQSQKAVTNLVHWANFYTDGGAANAYVLSIQSPTTAPTKYKTGMEVKFRTSNSNTGASTVNVASLGVKSIFKSDGTTTLSSGDITSSYDTRLRYDESLDAAAGAFILVSVSNQPAFSAYQASGSSLTAATPAKIPMDTETFDTHGYFDHVTNYRFTPLIAGKYMVILNQTITSNADYNAFVYLKKNTSTELQGEKINQLINEQVKLSVATIVDMNGTTDYIEAFVSVSAGTTINLEGGINKSEFSAYRLF